MGNLGRSLVVEEEVGGRMLLLVEGVAGVGVGIAKVLPV